MGGGERERLDVAEFRSDEPSSSPPVPSCAFPLHSLFVFWRQTSLCVCAGVCGVIATVSCWWAEGVSTDTYTPPTHPSTPHRITRPRINQFDPHCAGEPPVATSTLHPRMNRFARGWFDLALAKVMADRSSWILRCSPHSPHLPARHRSPTQSLALALKK